MAGSGRPSSSFEHGRVVRAGAGGFAWWDTHNQAWRRARLLFVLASGVVAIYAAGLLAVVGVLLRTAGVGPWHQIDGWIDDIGWLGLVLAGLVLLVVAGAAIACLGWRGLSRTTVRYVQARAPVGEEARAVGIGVSSIAIAYGIPAPRIWIIDDPAPNALAFGRPRTGSVCVTTGALQLPHDELETLCMFHVTTLVSRVFAYATAAADLVMLGEWLTRVIWTSAVVALLSVMVGTPIEIVGAYLIGVVVLVAATRPLLFVADRGLVVLLDETDELVDLELVRHTAQPASLAHLLLDILEDKHRAMSRWEVAHLWFERDVVDFVDGRRTVTAFRGDTNFDHFLTPAFVGRCTRTARRGLVARAETAVNLANGDAKLRARLASAGADV